MRGRFAKGHSAAAVASFKGHSIAIKVGLALAAMLSYVFAFAILEPVLGGASMVFAAGPVGVVGWSYGSRDGAVAGLLTLPLHTLLVILVSGGGWIAWFLPGGILASLALVLAGAVIGRVHDLGERISEELTQRRKADTELKATEQALWHDEELMRGVLQATSDAIIVADKGSRVVLCNASAENMFGWSSEDMLGQSIDNLMPERYQSNQQQVLERYLESRRRKELGPTTELEGPRRNSTTFPIEVSLGSYDTLNGPFLVAAVRDITERKRSEESLRESASLASVGELAAGVAHELNNPLAGVLGFAQLLMARELSPSTREDVIKIYEQAQRACKVVQNLLSFARKYQPERRYIDVRTVIAMAVALKVHDFHVSNIRVTSDLPSDIPYTMADEHQLQQVFMNILLNAEQAMVQAKDGGHLHMAARNVGGKIMLSFTDDGPGIPGDCLSRIFDPFFTTKGVGKGTGLGLSICYGIIQEHGGKIWAESEPGKGATFHVVLPILPNAADPRAQATDPLSTSSEQHILLVDDEPVVSNVLSRVLSGMGHSVDLAPCGEEAWHKIKSNRYDCIIIDLNISGISGQELYGLVREVNSDLARRIIFITGNTVRAEATEFLEATGNPVLGKPLNLKELCLWVERLTAPA